MADQPYIAGTKPRYVDYAVFSAFQWARLGSPTDVVKPDAAIAAWRSRMISMFDGLGDKFLGHPSMSKRSL